MKECKHCKQTLPNEQFYKSSAHSDGLLPICKTCRKIQVVNAVPRGSHKSTSPLNVEENTLATYHARELIAELRRRGYEGQLSIVQTFKV